MIDGEMDVQIVISRGALDGSINSCFDDRSRSLTDHPCNGTLVTF
jgi:hypothetical protein